MLIYLLYKEIRIDRDPSNRVYSMKKLLFLCITLCGFFLPALAKQKVCVLIPAYNEEKRIPSMLEAYLAYFDKQQELDTTFLVVANNCNDKTVDVCKKIQKKHKNLQILDLKPGGKGRALKHGFLHSLQQPYDLIGFVDADMATLPQYFHDLIKATRNHDGAIASRYISGANVWPKRPALRKLGGKFYNWLLRMQLGISFRDTQCGAKIFNYNTIKKVAPQMIEPGWAFDLEFLYLCYLENKDIVEIPTTWSDQPGSHLEISGKLMKEFLASPRRIKRNHATRKKECKKLKKRKDIKTLPV